MRTNSLLLGLIAGASLFSFAAAADDMDALIGKWSVKKVNDQGQNITQTFTIKKGKAIFQILGAEDRVVLYAEGDLKLDKVGPFNAAHFVNVNTPQLVVMPELSGPMELSIGDEQRLLISRQLGSGFTLAQLAFLGAKQLSYLRPELLWRVVFDSVERTANVLGFCVRYAQKGEELHKWVDDELRKPAKRFVAYLDDDELLAQLVVSAFADFDPEPSAWQLQAGQWLIAVDRAALRIGLLACASPPAAWPLISQQPQSSAMLLDEQLDEIARFAISQGHQALRKSLGLITET